MDEMKWLVGVLALSCLFLSVLRISLLVFGLSKTNNPEPAIRVGWAAILLATLHNLM